MSFDITPVARGYQEIHPYSVMNIDSVKINISLIMMKEWIIYICESMQHFLLTVHADTANLTLRKCNNLTLCIFLTLINFFPPHLYNCKYDQPTPIQTSSFSLSMFSKVAVSLFLLMERFKGNPKSNQNEE